MNDRDMSLLIAGLERRLGRLPTEEEMHDFIFGDKETREKIWNSNKKEEAK